MSTSTKEFINLIDTRINFINNFAFIQVTKQECSDILVLASEFKNKTKLNEFINNQAMLIPIYKIKCNNIEDSNIENGYIETFFKIKLEKNNIQIFKILIEETLKCLENYNTKIKTVSDQFKVCNLL